MSKAGGFPLRGLSQARRGWDAIVFLFCFFSRVMMTSRARYERSMTHRLRPCSGHRGQTILTMFSKTSKRYVESFVNIARASRGATDAPSCLRREPVSLATKRVGRFVPVEPEQWQRTSFQQHREDPTDEVRVAETRGGGGGGYSKMVGVMPYNTCLQEGSTQKKSESSGCSSFFIIAPLFLSLSL